VNVTVPLGLYPPLTVALSAIDVPTAALAGCWLVLIVGVTDVTVTGSRAVPLVTNGLVVAYYKRHPGPLDPANVLRFMVFDPNDPLPMFRGQLEAVNFDGVGGFKETLTPLEGGKDSALGIFKVMLTNMPPRDPHDELWLYHVASRTIIGGENLGWNLSKAELGGMGFMFRMMMKAEQVYIMTGPRPVLDKERVRANWRKI
jgi:hypothetical protein